MFLRLYLATHTLVARMAARMCFTASTRVSIFMAVMVAGRILSVEKFACKEGFYSFISISGNTCIKHNACVAKCHLSATADTATD